jgi:hypothetical protein
LLCGVDGRALATVGAFVVMFNVTEEVPFAVGVNGFGVTVQLARDGHPATVNAICELNPPCDPTFKEVEKLAPAFSVALLVTPESIVKSGCDDTMNPAVA